MDLGVSEVRLFRDTIATQHKEMLYTAILGASFAYFLALFSGYSQLDNSLALQVSTILMALSIAVNTCFLMMVRTLKNHEISALQVYTTYSVAAFIKIFFVGPIVFALGLVALIFHFSLYAGWMFLITMPICATVLGKIINKIKNNNEE